MTKLAFDRVAVIGLGLIGGSIAAALRRQGVYISAFDINPGNVAAALDLGLIDRADSTIESAVSGADLILLAVPVLAMPGVFASITDSFNHPGVIITDVGSVKQSVVDAIRGVSGEVPENFVPAHPIAGSEQHGVNASDPGLFARHQVILTPLAQTSELATQKVGEMWASFGAQVVHMQVSHHDLILAKTSHLPHLLAFALIDTLSAQGDSLEIFNYAAGGLKDFSRIAASDATMWRDIFQSNRGPLMSILDTYMKDLADLRLLIEQDQMDEVYDLLERARQARNHFGRILQDRAK